MPSVVSLFGVEPRRIGGTETFARQLSMQLGERGWESLLCFLSEPQPDVKQFLQLPNVRFEVVPDSTNGGRKSRRALSKILQQTKAEILHLHFVSFLNRYSWLAAKNSVKQIFFTDHHSRPAGYLQARAAFWKRAAARAINLPLTKVICVSEYGYDCMTALDLLPSDRFEMIYNGVDLSRVKFDIQRADEFRARYEIPAGRSIVTQVSWIIPEKGITDFLETANIVLRENKDVQFVLVGDGAHRDQFQQQAESMGISDHLTWTGMIEDPFGAGVFEAADIVCQFSRWEEVFGWMIAEAMAHGKPVVATRVGGIPELIQDGANGFLVNRGDTQAMAEKVLSLLKEIDTRRRLGALARATVYEKFNLKTNVAKLIDAYRLEQLSSSPSSPHVVRLQESAS